MPDDNKKPVDMNSPLDDTPETAKLKRENEQLSQQVKRLIRAEGKLYEFQEKLDAQLREYQDLYDLNRKLHATVDLGDIFRYAVEYVIHKLGYERVLIFQQVEGSDDFRVCSLDGYYSPEEKDSAMEVTVKWNDLRRSGLPGDRDYLICKSGAEVECLAGWSDKLRMDEYLIYPLVSATWPFGILAIGNSAANAGFYRRVSDEDGALLGAGNLVELLTSSIENYIYHTHMERALEEKRVAEEKYRGIFENAPDGLLQTYPDGRFLKCNPATAAILGYDSPEELVRSVPTIARLYTSPLRRQELYDLMQKKMDVKDFAVEIYRKDGSKRWVLVSTHPVFSEKGEMLYVDSIIRDITERKQAEEERLAHLELLKSLELKDLQADIVKREKAEEALRLLSEELDQRVMERTSQLQTANDELRTLSQQLEGAFNELKSAQSRILQQEKMASIGQLAAGVAHEINNPVGFIMSNLRSLQKYSDKHSKFIRIQAAALRELSPDGNNEVLMRVTGQQKAMKLDYITEDIGNLISESIEGAERVKNIVQDLKGFSRVDEAEHKTADINTGLESTINIVWNELKYKATIRKEYGDVPAIKCNPGQLNQVFMNILINAAHSIEKQGEITVRTWHEDGYLKVSIADTGSGIPEDMLGRIFDPFFTTKEVGKGTGLGLSIAYDIIKKHEGEIQVESEVGKGTTFTIVIPIAAE